MSQSQIDSEVPTLIQDIVDANSSLSKTGFGPLRKGGLALYAGRWIDPATGRVRLIPTASKDYINPLSYDQTIAFHQARLLNNWNKLVNDMEAYNKLMATDRLKFETDAETSLKNKGTASTDKKNVIKKYLTGIASFFTTPMRDPQSSVMAAFVNSSAAKKLMSTDNPTGLANGPLNAMITSLNKAMTEAGTKVTETFKTY